MALTKAELLEAAAHAKSAGSDWKRIGRILENADELIDEIAEDGTPLTSAQITARKNRMATLRTRAEASIASLDALIAS